MDRFGLQYREVYYFFQYLKFKSILLVKFVWFKMKILPDPNRLFKVTFCMILTHSLKRLPTPDINGTERHGYSEGTHTILVYSLPLKTASSVASASNVPALLITNSDREISSLTRITSS
jgi:hypothetical protein